MKLLEGLTTDLSHALGAIAARRRQAEAKASLVKSENRFRSLIENAWDLITIIDAQGQISYQSPAVERLLGFTLGERTGRSVFDNVHPEEKELVAAAFRDAMSGALGSRMIAHRMRHKSGEWRVLE